MTPEPKRLSRVYMRKRCGPVVIGDVLYAKGGSFGPRTQMDFQLVIIHSGQLCLKLDDETINVPENYGILLSPRHREHFFFAPDRDTHHSWVAIAPHALTIEMRRQFAAFPGPIPFLGRMASLLDLARKASVFFSGAESLQMGFYQGLAISILCDFASAVCSGYKKANAGEAVLSRMERFLADSCTDPLTLNDIARAASVSRQHLLKLCRAAGKPTPIKQMYAKRIELAADLLLHTGFSVAEIAEQCGFVNQFHFSRKFKQATGSCPQAWRNHLWKTMEPRN